MESHINLSAVFEHVLKRYDTISPKLLLNDFEQASGTTLLRAKVPAPKEVITYEMLDSTMMTGEPALHLDKIMERHALANSMILVRHLFDTQKPIPSADTISELRSALQDYKNTSAGNLNNALTAYLTLVALEYAASLAKIKIEKTEVSTLEKALGIAPQ